MVLIVMLMNHHHIQGDITVYDSDSELCFGQSFGGCDKGYNSMMQIEAVEQKMQRYKDGKKTLIM